MTVIAPSVEVRVRPRGELVRTGAVSLTVAMVPLTAAAWVTAMNGGNWRLLVTVQLALLVLATFAVLRWRMLETRVTASELTGNGFLSPMLRVPLDRIAAAHLVPTYTQSGEIVHQLLVTDAEGRRLFRRRESYWGAAALERVAAALPVAVEVVDAPVSIRAFWRAHPSAAYWFEDNPIVRALSAAAVVLIALTLAAGTVAMMQ